MSVVDMPARARWAINQVEQFAATFHSPDAKRGVWRGAALGRRATVAAEHEDERAFNLMLADEYQRRADTA